MRRRQLFLATAITMVVGYALAAACTFPEPTFTPDELVDGSPDAPATDGAEDVSNDVQVLVDGGDPDALIVKDAGQRIDASGCTSCDCDGDDFNALTRPGCMDAGGLDDCDDEDTRTRPDQGFLSVPQEKPRNGDWNCANGVEKFYEPNIDCKTLSRGPACDATFGFAEDPPCGSTGKFVTCKSVGTPPLYLDGACVVGAQNLTTIQACK